MRVKSALSIAQAHVDRATLRAPRGTFPIVRAFVAELREAGLDPRLTYACEGGLTVGTPDARNWVPVSLPHTKPKPRRA